MMSTQEIDDYLATVPEPNRSALGALRQRILDIVPDAEQCISYAMPAFKVRGKVIAGFAAFTNHLGYYPHSGSVIAQVQGDTQPFAGTKSALHFTAERPLPDQLVAELIAVRMRQAFPEN
jgi:uncharacterized protein YdhG (YjbR/CyaY superfamily)